MKANFYIKHWVDLKNYVTISLQFFENYRVISLILLALLSSNLKAQDQEKQLTKADQSFKAFAYIDARAIYLDVAQQGYVTQNLLQKLADSYYLTGELEDSVIWYEKLTQAYAVDLDPEYLFRYAQSLKSVERYKEADVIMEKFITITGNDKRAKSFINKRNYLDFIEMQSGRYDLFKLSINSENSEYAPSFDHDSQIVFASSRSKTTKNSKLHSWNKMPFLDIFSSKIKEDQMTLEEPTKLKGKINTKYHESSTTFSKDGKTIYFSRNNYTKNKLETSKKGVVLLKIYKASLIDGKWIDIQELPFCSNNYSVSHPSLSADGTKLYFASDMPGTLGKSDVFFVDIYEDGKYGEPKNLGDKINTEGRETFPYISDSNRLYFASDGHVGLGGLDIFVAIPETSGFSTAFNVGKPVNSSKDDFSFVLNEETKIGYFASNRKGGKGNDDIYSFKQTQELITSCKQYIEGVVFNTETNESIANADLKLLDSNGTTIGETKANSLGVYKFEVECNTEYFIKASSNQFHPKEITLNTDDIFEYVHDLSIPLNASKDGDVLLTSVAINIGDDLSETLQMDPIHFRLNDSLINPEAEVELQKIITTLKKYPDLKIEVRSHTDSRSSYWYNKKLSVQRMRATIQYIVEKGDIYWRRVRGKAYGERRLLNNCTDDVPCTEEQHQENRRSEFIIIE